MGTRRQTALPKRISANPSRPMITEKEHPNQHHYTNQSKELQQG